MSYDQWKTASPYDDEPDPILEAERWIKFVDDRKENEEMGYKYDHLSEEVFELVEILRLLRDIIKDEL